MKKIGFIGQGYIGKNYALDFEKRKYKVVRYALEPQYLSNKKYISGCDIVFIAVPTPTRPKGFDGSIVESVIPLVGQGKIAVIKSTLPPGTTRLLQKKYPKVIILHSPEFLSEATAKYEASHPFSNIIGIPVNNKRWRVAAMEVHKILPKASFSLTCKSDESEIIKYTHNISGFVQIIFFNLIYDLCQKLGLDWSVVGKAIKADPLISNRYANPVHKSGRGAGGHCFIKDFASFVYIYKKNIPKDTKSLAFLNAVEKKNIDLLISSQKDLNLLSGVYGNDIITK